MINFDDEQVQLRSCADVEHLPRYLGGVAGTADFRCALTDFQVTESGFEPSGSGEHLLLRVRKAGQNTRWVAKRLAEVIGIPYRAVSYAGLKDRHAITEQWFGVHLPGRPDPDMDAFSIEGVEVLMAVRHDRKLRPGQLSFNFFEILLRNCEIDSADKVATRLHEIAAVGVPNYFGPQRFGRGLGNLELLRKEVDIHQLNREQRAFALSALRGALFNGYLASRVSTGDWDQLLSGEVEISDRPRGIAEQDRSVFEPERLPTGLLWGKGDSVARGEAAERERAWFEQFPRVRSILEKAGARASRRVLRLRVAKLVWQQQNKDLRLSFALGPGAYATVVLRELFSLTDRSRQDESLVTP